MQPDNVIEYRGQACILFGAPPLGVLDEVDGTQVPGIPVYQLGLLQTGDVGRLGSPSCHDAFCIADIILQYLLEDGETLNRQASRLDLLDFCFTSMQPLLRKGAPSECLGLRESQFTASFRRI
ncbi:hypothetical protein GL58_24320 [Comamonas testosteroni]|uniref:Uncharacterized protein n=1 Tax=Comamonas testosteroni TaxID=285 RepID=A0A0L7N302_COMTE|nr:hypothetical protein GL58_24320 [Comamonas testosteroni]